HTPHTPDPEELPHVADTPKEHHNFNAVLRRYDREVGRLLDFLKVEGLEGNTIVIFSSDNGPQPSFQGQRAGGLRGMKWSLYEGGDGEPFLARWAGKVPASKADETTGMGAGDLFPTLCALAGVADPKDAGFDGVDLSVALLGKVQERSRPMFWEYGRKAD